MTKSVRGFLVFLTFLTFWCGCSTPTAVAKTPLVVFAAGSLIIPFHQLEDAFEARYPTIDVQSEYHGSIQVMRHVTDLHESIDVVATADVSLIPMVMYASVDEETGKSYADWYIHFATNKLGVAYQPESKYADMINSQNWYEILSRPDVRVGIADPRFDASGYRTLMAFGLANTLYQDPKIFSRMFKGRFNPAVSLFQDDGLATVTVPEIVDTVSNSGLIVRGASVELLALLESGDLDYAFEYESVIRQHDMELLSLPEEVNLGSETMDYSGIEVKLDFQRFATLKPLFKGEQIGYGITVPTNSPHPEEAELYIAFLLGPEGRAIMQANNQPLFDSPVGVDYGAIPVNLQTLCVSERP
ncbi:MAG: tungstate ABC transporter substrate-binding protein WtpA [Chloroflexi bacterium]|nr:tungstate ABC transporter substrate-binding protein WtpA [Chloroflexota bacterium]